MFPHLLVNNNNHVIIIIIIVIEGCLGSDICNMVQVGPMLQVTDIYLCS